MKETIWDRLYKAMLELENLPNEQLCSQLHPDFHKYIQEEDGKYFIEWENENTWKPIRMEVIRVNEK